MALPPIVKKEKYTRTKHGILGSMGTGDTRINYIQTTFLVNELSELGLVCEIPGSEQWPIRQLFQRDLDEERVTDGIIPYFTKSSKVKFFNPITIAVLPIDVNGGFESGIREVEEEPASDFPDGRSYAIDSLYKVSFSNNDPSWAEIKWNPSKVKMIAIDGQHRLSALKRMQANLQRDPGNSELEKIDFSKWIIPAIIVTVGHVEKLDNTYTLLNKTRDIFVTINQEAKKPSRCRTILLNDYSVTAICTQELLDTCRNDHDLPLAIFDWREHRDPDRPDLSTTLARVDEIEDWLIYYFLGDDDKASGKISLTDEQKEELFVSDMTPPLDCSDDNVMREGIKKQFAATLLPAIKIILTQCHPYSSYIGFVKKQIESAKDDIAEHAWSRITFGTDYAPSAIEKSVTSKKNEILDSCNSEKIKMGEEYRNLIGLRGLLSGFTIFAHKYWENIEIKSWSEIADIYVAGFNAAYATRKISKDSGLLRHLAFDHNDSIINYKLDDVYNNFGQLCAYAAISKLDLLEKLGGDEMERQLHKNLVKGYKKEVRPSVKDSMVGKSKEEQEEEVNKIADERSSAQLKKISKAFKKA